MSVLTALISNMGLGSITANLGGWGTTSDTTPTITGGSRTLTVPGGNPGNLQFQILANACTQQYSKQGAAFVTFANNDIVNFSNNNTLQFRITSSGSGSYSDGNVVDATTGALVGNMLIEHT